MKLQIMCSENAPNFRSIEAMLPPDTYSRKISTCVRVGGVSGHVLSENVVAVRSVAAPATDIR